MPEPSLYGTNSFLRPARPPGRNARGPRHAHPGEAAAGVPAAVPLWPLASLRCVVCFWLMMIRMSAEYGEPEICQAAGETTARPTAPGVVCTDGPGRHGLLPCGFSPGERSI